LRPTAGGSRLDQTVAVQQEKAWISEPIRSSTN
jgi:hypothetical protein